MYLHRPSPGPVPGSGEKGFRQLLRCGLPEPDSPQSNAAPYPAAEALPHARPTASAGLSAARPDRRGAPHPDNGPIRMQYPPFAVSHDGGKALYLPP